MRTIRMTVAYDGTAYVGWQWQPAGASIQRTIEEAMGLLAREKVTLVASGRTDAGVHALAQVAHFRTTSDLPCDRMLVSLNGLLPKDIVVTSLADVSPEFHARRSAKQKTYRYWIWNDRIASPFFRGHSWQIFQPLDVDAMNRAAALLVGDHDFRSFRGQRAGTTTSVRHVVCASVERRSPPRIAFDITATGFLKQMVRNIVGTLVQVGQGRRTPESIADVIAACDRRAAGPTAPACGLFLVCVAYDGVDDSRCRENRLTGPDDDIASTGVEQVRK